ncbi:MAG: ABC transporter ATP-binding protein [Paracoccaceae bacterium]
MSRARTSLVFENVSKEFRVKGGVKTVVRDLNMAIPRGRSLALLGRNGAGKSTLLSMVAGALKPDRGRILRNANISFPLGFAGSFHKDLTGAQNVRFVARIYGVDEEMLIDYVQDFAEIGPFIDQPVRVYSSGMKARLAFGVSMGIRFDVYLVDELTAVGDQNFKKKSKAVFESKLANSDVIMVSHSVNQLRRYCDCGLVLEDGRLEVFDDLEAAIERHHLNMREVSGAVGEVVEDGAGPARRKARPGRRDATRGAAARPGAEAARAPSRNAT